MKIKLPLEKLLACLDTVVVDSLADGHMTVSIGYRNGLPSDVARMAIAEELTRVCKARVKRAKHIMVGKG